MRSIFALSALALVSLMGCNQGQPRIYRVAIDETPIRTIAVPSCFRGNNLPAGRGNTTEMNYRTEKEWVIWQGTVNERNVVVEYLDLGTQTFRLGDAPVININQLIEGSEMGFSALRNVQEPQPAANGGIAFTEARQTQVNVKWNDYSFAPTGKIDLSAQYACIRGSDPCPDGMAIPQDAASCSSSINFVARRIDAQQTTAYNNNP